jgi:hypothetical protein
MSASALVAVGAIPAAGAVAAPDVQALEPRSPSSIISISASGRARSTSWRRSIQRESCRCRVTEAKRRCPQAAPSSVRSTAALKKALSWSLTKSGRAGTEPIAASSGGRSGVSAAAGSLRRCGRPCQRTFDLWEHSRRPASDRATSFPGFVLWSLMIPAFPAVWRLPLRNCSDVPSLASTAKRVRLPTSHVAKKARGARSMLASQAAPRAASPSSRSAPTGGSIAYAPAAGLGARRGEGDSSPRSRPSPTSRDTRLRCVRGRRTHWPATSAGPSNAWRSFPTNPR